MRNDFCTGYLAHSAKGKEWSKHKYVAKVKLANGRYFYFYNMQQYLNYQKKLGDAEREKVNQKKAAATSELAGKDSTLKETSMTAEERRAADIERVKGAKATSSSKSKKGSSKSSSSKSSKNSSKSKGSSSKSKSSTAKEKTSTGSSKKQSESKSAKATTKQTAQATTQATQEVKKTPTLSTYKYQYDLKEKDVDNYTGQSSDTKITQNQIEEIIQDAVDKYPDNSSGFVLAGFDNDINYSFKWVKENGSIKLVDPDTNEEISATNALLNMNSVSLFRTDDKNKKS